MRLARASIGASDPSSLDQKYGITPANGAPRVVANGIFHLGLVPFYFPNSDYFRVVMLRSETGYLLS
jgi:hypothetical protein